MGYQLSPGVEVREIDLTTIVPAVATSDGTIAGLFHWGPIQERVLIDNQDVLIKRFGKPSNLNAETWFSAANFLDYANRLYVVRTANTTAVDANVGCWNAYAKVTPNAVVNTALQVVRNEKDYEVKDGTFDTDVLYVAKYPGSVGNSLRISVCDSANAFTSSLALQGANINSTFAVEIGATTATITAVPSNGAVSMVTVNTFVSNLISSIGDNDYVELGNTQIGVQYLKVLKTDEVPTTNSTHSTFKLYFDSPYRLPHDFSSNTSLTRYWEFYSLVDETPGQSDYVAQYGNTAAQDGMHVILVDDAGKFSGIPGSVLEAYKNVSRATDAKSDDNVSIYYKEVINKTSQYIWFANDRPNAVSNTALNVASSTNQEPLNVKFTNGNDGVSEANVSLGILASGYDQIASKEDVDISLVIQGRPRGGTDVATGIKNYQLGNWLIDNIAEQRKDCVAFISPDKEVVINNVGDEALDLVKFRNLLRSSSYGVLDSGYKYQYDRYNDLYRWIPLNADIAGLCARTDQTNDPWWSPAGYNRGHIKNVVRLAFNPRKAHRDVMYKSGVNPVVNFPGEGIILFGDKTLLAKPSAFDRINVRRLFIVLEKAISLAAKYLLFEFNDEFTRAQFRSMVVPYLADVKGRRGIYDFLVVCDESNNTPEVIDRNEFVGDIYIKPARSINFISLNFVAVRTGVSFSTVVGQF